MPRNSDGSFERDFKFVDRFTSNEKINRTDLDAAFDDIAAGLNSVSKSVTSYVTLESLISSGVTYADFSEGAIVLGGQQYYRVASATAIDAHEVTVAGESGGGGLKLYEVGQTFSTLERAQSGDTLGAFHLIVDGLLYAPDDDLFDITTGDGRKWQLKTPVDTVLAIDTFVGDGTQGPFLLSKDPGNATLIDLTVAGVPGQVAGIDFQLVDNEDSVSGKALLILPESTPGDRIVATIHAPAERIPASLGDLHVNAKEGDAQEAIDVRGPSYGTRAEGVEYSQSAYAQILGDGATFTANNRVYQRRMGATDIADMPGWVPFGHIIFPDQFGDGFDGVVEDTATVRMCHFYANANNLWVTYSGCDYASIQANAWIVVNSHFNLSSCELKAVGGLRVTPESHTVNTMYHVYDVSTPLVTGNVATPAADGSMVADLKAGSTRPTPDFLRHAGYAYIQGSGGTGPNIANRDKDGLLSYRQSFAIHVNGRVVQPLSVDMTTETELWYSYRLMPARGRINIGGGTVDTTTFNNQEIFRIERNNVGICDMQFLQKDGDADPDTINRLIKIYNAAFVYFDDVVGHAQQDGGDGGGTYVFNFENFAEVYMNNCSAIEGWGAMGTNNGNGLYISNCNLNRVDFHNGGHNYFVSDSTIYNRGVYVGWGGGTLKITNCKWIDAPVVQFRTDYGGYFYGDIIVDGIEASINNFVWTIVDALTNRVGTKVISAPVARGIVIRNCHRTDLDDNGNNREIVPLGIGVNTDATILPPIAPSNVHISGISCAGNWRMSCPVDYQNMLLPDDTDFCSWMFNDVKATRRQFDGLGINIPAHVAKPDLPDAVGAVGDFKVELRVEDCTKVSINVENHSHIQTHVYNTDLCRASTPDFQPCEIDGGLMTDPDWREGETHVPVGGSRLGVGYTTIRNMKVTGEVDDDVTIGWDLSGVETMIGVDIPDISANDTIKLPTGCLPAHAYFGWRKDDPTGEITPDYWGRNTTPGTTDMTAAIEAAIEYAADNGQTLHLKGNYAFTNLNPAVTGDLVSIQGAVGSKFTQLSTRDPDVPIFDMSGIQVAANRTVITAAYAGEKSVELNDASNFTAGRIVQLQTNQLIEGDHRFLEDYCVQQTLKVASVDLNTHTVTFTTPLLWDISLGVIATGTAQGGASGQITLRSGETAVRDDVRNRQIRIISGTGAGQTRYIHDYDAGSETVSLGIDYYGGGTEFDQDDWDVVPDATSVYEIFADCDAHCWDSYHPEIRGLHLIGYEEEGVNVQGMNIGFADRPVMEFCHIEGCSNNGLYSLNTFKPIIRFNRFDRANYAYEVEGNFGAGRGYGYLSSGDFGGMFYGNIMSGCRTGADVIKGTYDLKRFNNQVYGGGKTFDGEDFYPVGQITNSGLSSHTGAINIYDSGNTCHDVYQNKLRGHHICNGNNRSGSAARGYYISYTKKAHVLNDNYSDIYTYTPLVSDSVFETGSDGPVFPATPPDLPEFWVNINQASMVENASVIVNGNTVSALRSDFVNVGEQSTDSDLMLEVVGNHATIVKDSGAGDISVIDSVAPLSLGKLICHSNELHWGGSAAGSVAYDNFSPYPIINQLEPSDMVIDLGNGTFAAVMGANERIVVPIGKNRNSFWISAYHNSDISDSVTGFRWSGMVGRTAGAVYTATSNNATFHPANTTLTAGSMTLGQIHLSIMSNGTLQFLNRTGSEGIFIIEVGQQI